MRTIQDVLTRVRAEYLEMPGLRLTPEQVQRLCGIERALCEQVLASLVAEKFLCAKSDGHYGRLSDGAQLPHPKPASVRLNLDRRDVNAA